MTEPKHIPTQEELDKYVWYHSFCFPNMACTKKTVDCPDVWAHIDKTIMRPEFFNGKDVLDVGCRDCWWSLNAEWFGAKSVTGIDIDLNPGVEKLIFPFYDSRIRQRQLNAMNLTATNDFDTIFCAGLLYHIRYPFSLLNILANALRPGGLLLLETALLARPEVEEQPMLWCPVEHSPYEPSSCTFFNVTGLIVSARSFGLIHKNTWRMFRTAYNPKGMDRGTFVFEKGDKDENLTRYWNENNLRK